MNKQSEVLKVWRRFFNVINGTKVNFRWEQLMEHRYDEFIDFKMEHYVKRELTHVIAGVHKNTVALDEYRKIIFELSKDPSYHTAICCIDDGSSKMVGFSSMKAYKRGEIYKDTMEAKTKEVRRYFDISHRGSNIYPVPAIMTKFGVTDFFDDNGLAFHPDYCGYGLASEALRVRYIMSKAYGIPLLGGWMTSQAVQKSGLEHCETIYEISSEELGYKLGITFKRPQMFMYKIIKCN